MHVKLVLEQVPVLLNWHVHDFVNILNLRHLYLPGTEVRLQDTFKTNSDKLHGLDSMVWIYCQSLFSTSRSLISIVFYIIILIYFLTSEKTE